MSQCENLQHYITRAEQERDMAANATDLAAAISHNAMAALFVKIIAEKNPRKASAAKN
jgi:hypothetical protein